jgi:hypothetical protein
MSFPTRSYERKPATPTPKVVNLQDPATWPPPGPERSRIVDEAVKQNRER